MNELLIFLGEMTSKTTIVLFIISISFLTLLPKKNVVSIYVIPSAFLIFLGIGLYLRLTDIEKYYLYLALRPNILYFFSLIVLVSVRIALRKNEAND